MGLDPVQKGSPSRAAPIRIGSKIAGALEDADPVLAGKGRFRSFRLASARRGKVTIRVVSAYFNADLLVRDQSGATIAEDENGGPGDGAQLVIEVEAKRRYTVLVVSSSEKGLGAFELQTRRGALRPLNHGEELERDRGWYETVLERTDISPHRRASVLIGLGGCRYDLDSPAEARRLLEEALAILRETGDRKAEAKVLGNLGNAAVYLGQPDVAVRRHEEAIEIYRDLKDEGGEADVLGNLGNAYAHLAQFDRALECHEKALRYHRRTGDRGSEADVLGNLGSVYRDLGQREKSIRCYELALKIYREREDRRGQGWILGNLGSIYGERGETEKEIELYQQALKIHREVKNRRSEAITLCNLGVCHNNLKKPETAIPYLEQAFEIHREREDVRGQGVVLGNLGGSYAQLGRLDEAIGYYERSFESHRAARNASGAIQVLQNLAKACQELFRHDAAIEHYTNALNIAREANSPELAAVHATLANLYYDLGRTETAINEMERALELHRKTGNHREVAGVLNDLGNFFDDEPEKALQCYRQALTIFQDESDRQGEGVVLGNLGNVYRHLGLTEKAIEYCERALKIHRETSNRVEEGTVLANLGIAYNALHQHEKAIAYYEDALPIHRETRDRLGEAICLQNLGLARAHLGQREKAVADYQKALGIHRELGSRRHEGVVLGHLGTVYATIGEPERALEYYKKALEARREVKDRALVASTLWDLGRLHASADHLNPALDSFREAHRLEEELLQGVELGLEESAVLSVSAGLRMKFADYSGLLARMQGPMERGPERDAIVREALQTAEGLRARTLRSAMRAGDVRHLLSPAGRERWDRVHALQASLSKLVTRTIQLPPGETPSQRETLETLRAQAKRHEEEIASLEQALKTEEPKFAELFARSSDLDSRRLRTVLGANELLLHYNIVGPQVMVFTWDRERELDLHVLDVDTAALAGEAMEVYQALESRPTTREATASLKERLAGFRRKLFHGLEARVDAAEGLVIVPDDFLHLFPWEALVVEDGRYLIEKRPVRYAPSIQVLLELRGRATRRAGKELVIYGDPDFGRATTERPEVAFTLRGGEELAALAHAADEVKQVGGLFSRESVIRRTGARAQEGRFKSESRRGAILHVATHGRFAASPEALRLPLFHSGLVFAGYNRGGAEEEEDGFLTAGEVMGLDLRAVDLAVLSACQTAAGMLGSEGKFGLERAFFVAGVRTFVGSLWQVDDHATSEIMVAFYRNLRAGLAKPEALRRAKLELIARPGELAARGGRAAGDRGRPRLVPKQNRDLSHPYYWAPFVLSGDASRVRKAATGAPGGKKTRNDGGRVRQAAAEGR